MVKETQEPNTIQFAVKQVTPTKLRGKPWTLQIAYFMFEGDAVMFAASMKDLYKHLEFEVVEVVK